MQANASDCACKALDQRLDQLDSTLTSTSERISGLVGQVTLLQSWKAEQAAVPVDRGSGILSGTPSFEASLGGSAPWSEAGTPNGGTPRRGLGSNPELGISSSFVQRQEFQVCQEVWGTYFNSVILKLFLPILRFHTYLPCFPVI